MSPIDYSTQVQSPFAAALQGYQGGTAIRNDQAQQTQLQAQRAQQQAMQQDLYNLSTKEGVTGQDYAGAMTKYPQLSEQLKKSWDVLNSSQQQAKLSQGTQAYAAIRAGRPDIAEKSFRDRSEAAKVSGDEKSAKEFQSMADLIKLDPKNAATSVGLSLAAYLGPEKFAQTYATLSQEGRASDQAPADLATKQAGAVTAQATAGIKTFEARTAPQRLQMDMEKQTADIDNISSTIADRTARLGLDKDKLLTDTKFKMTELNRQFGELPPDARKNLNDASAQATSSEQSASQILSLASRLDAAGGGYGAFGSAGEWIKKATGNQDGMTALKQEYTRIRSQGVMKALPPGPATDRDVALAMEGFPPANADAKQLASFLRGMAKLQTYDAALNGAKAQWFGEVHHLGDTKKDIEIDGVKVPAGTSFNAFAKKYLESTATKTSNDATIKSAPYGVFANPPASGGASGGF